MTASTISQLLRAPPRLFHDSMTAAEIRGFEILQRALDIDNTVLCRLQQHSQSPSDTEPFLSCDPHTELFIHEQQVGVFLFGQLNRLAFSRVKFRQMRISAPISHRGPRARTVIG